MMDSFHLIVLLFMTQKFIVCVTTMCFCFRKGDLQEKNNEELM